ncbi:hypothetical protein TNCV_1774131 [Trichonephila clavipes]|nr:hypothetical protein TNCV_1774131 [Trichonephila clavipes]
MFFGDCKCKLKSRKGSRRATTFSEYRYLALMARRQHLRSWIGNPISTQTVRNWLHAVGLYAHRPMLCVTLKEEIIRMEWPLCSPDINPIEHVWDILGSRIAGHLPHPRMESGRLQRRIQILFGQSCVCTSVETRGERLNLNFTVQRHTVPATVTCIAIHGKASRSYFSTKQCPPKHIKLITGLPLSHFHSFLSCSISRFVTNPAYLVSLRTASWTVYEFGRFSGVFTATVGRDVAEHHTGLLCLSARSYHIIYLC